MNSPTIESLHKRLLNAQKDIKLLKDATYADHRLMEKMDKRISINQEILKKLTNIVEQMNEHDIKTTTKEGKNIY